MGGTTVEARNSVAVELALKRMADECDKNVQCLVCHSCGNMETLKVSSSVLSRQLDMYFILKHVLDLPYKQLVLYLKHCSEPKEWIKICSICSEMYVKDCKQVYGQLLEIKRKFAEVKLKFTEAIKRSAKEEQASLATTGGDYSFDETLDLDSITAGDLLASEKLFAKQQIGSVKLEPNQIDGRDIKQEVEKFHLDLENQADTTNINDNEVKTETLLEESDYSSAEEEITFPVQQSENSTCDYDYDPTPLALIAEDDIFPVVSPITTDQDNHANQQNVLDRKRKAVSYLPSCDDVDDDDWAEANLTNKGDARDPDFDVKEEKKSAVQRKKYCCGECTWRSNSRISIINHRKRLHGNDMDLPKRTCSICQKVLASVRAKRSHIAYVHAGKRRKYQCEHCGKEYSDKVPLRKHLSKVHNIDQSKYQCSFDGCNEVFVVKRELDQHMDLHNPLGFKCDTCEKVFRSRRRLKQHVENIHKNEGKRPIQCDLCPATFASTTGLKTHLKHLHTSSDENKRKRKVFVSYCTQCDASFISHKKLREHMERAHGTLMEETFKCSTCNGTYSSKFHLERHIEVTHEKKYQVCCEICGKTLLSPRSLISHKLRVHKIGNGKEHSWVECAVEGCKKLFINKADMSKHVRIKHEGLRPHQCDQCGQRLISENQLRRHILAVHTNRETKPFKCLDCGKDFAIEEYLLQHQRGHCTANKVAKQE